MLNKTPMKRNDAPSKWQGIDPQKINEYAEFAWAIDTLAERYGIEVRDCLLNRKVDLTHRELLTLAVVALQHPEEYKYAGYSIRKGDTKTLKWLIGSNE